MHTGLQGSITDAVRFWISLSKHSTHNSTELNSIRVIDFIPQFSQFVRIKWNSERNTGEKYFKIAATTPLNTELDSKKSASRLKGAGFV